MQLTTAWNNIRRSPFQALAAIFTLAITFFVVTVLVTFVYSSSNVLSYFETRPQVIAFIKDDADIDTLTSFQDKIGNDSRVKDVKFVSKEDALSFYKQATADNPLLSELVDPSIFPASYEISIRDFSSTGDLVKELSEESFIESVGYTASLRDPQALSQVIDQLKTISQYVRVGGGAFVAFLVGTSFLVLMIIISMRMTARKGEIEILDLIGATPGFIRSPIVLEGLIYGIVGTVLGWVMGFIVILYATPQIISYFNEIPILPRDTVTLVSMFGILLGIELLVSILLALSGTLFAIGRAKKRP
jgi:cell division transport system permease protein